MYTYMFQPDVSACDHRVFLHGSGFLGALGTWSNHVPWRNGEFGWNTFRLINLIWGVVLLNGFT